MEEQEYQPSYYTNIPASVRYDKEIPANGKLLYGEISCLSNKYGYCFATNKYFAELYELSEDRISKLLHLLEKKGYLEITINRDNKNFVVNRQIKLLDPALLPSQNGKNNYSKTVKIPGGNGKNNGSIINTNNNTFNTNTSSSFDEEERAELLKIIDEQNAVILEYKEKEKVSAPKKKSKSSTPKNSEPQLLDDEFYKTLVKHYNSVYKSVFPNGFPNSKGYRPQVDRAYTKLQELGHSDEKCKELLLKAITNAPRISFWRTSGDNGANGALAFILSETGLGKMLSLDNEPQVAIKKGQSAFDDNKKREYTEEGKW